MQEIIKTVDMNEAQWLANRRGGIGGSDVSAILGINKYRTPFEVWLDKTGQIPIDTTETSEAIHFGNVFEEVVAQEFSRRAGKKVFKQNKTYIHPDYPMLRANIDRDIAHEPGFLECKTANAYLASEWKDDEVPAPYLLQVQHYMNVLDRPYCYIAVLIGGQQFKYKRIERDQELIDVVQGKLVSWWNKYVINGEQPPIDGSDAATNFLKDYLVDKSEGDVIQLQSDDFNRIKQRQQLKSTEKDLKQAIASIDNHLKLELTTADEGQLDGYKVGFKTYRKESIDKAMLKDKYPDIYKDVVRNSKYRRLTIKEDLHNGNE